MTSENVIEGVPVTIEIVWSGSVQQSLAVGEVVTLVIITERAEILKLQIRAQEP